MRQRIQSQCWLTGHERESEMIRKTNRKRILWMDEWNDEEDMGVGWGVELMAYTSE